VYQPATRTVKAEKEAKLLPPALASKPALG
jgi:hypothetical protein